MRAYYSQHQQQHTWQQQYAVVSQLQLPQLQPPSAADLSALVVGVSRLVQMEYGALHGQGECQLRDQVRNLGAVALIEGTQQVQSVTVALHACVLDSAAQVVRLLSGLLAVEGCGFIRKEQRMSGPSSHPPRSDLAVKDLQGRSLLVAEYKQRHSGAASACQQQDTAQVRRQHRGLSAVQCPHQLATMFVLKPAVSRPLPAAEEVPV